VSDNVKEVRCTLTKEDYNAFRAIANASGFERSHYLAGRLLIKGLMLEFIVHQGMTKELKSKWDNLPDDVKDIVEMERMEFLERRKDEHQALLNKLATRNLSSQDAEKLSGIASRLDLDEQKAADYATDNPFASVIHHISNPNTQIGKCMQWLSEVFSAYQEIPVKTMVEEGEKKGFSEVTMKRSKRKLGIIHRKRKSDGAWCWYPPNCDLLERNVPQFQPEEVTDEIDEYHY